MCQDPGVGPLPGMWKNSKQIHVAGAEYGMGREGGGDGRQGADGGRSCRAPWATGKTWAFTPWEVGTLEGCGQRGNKT